jgi:hypothetical protein
LALYPLPACHDCNARFPNRAHGSLPHLQHLLSDQLRLLRCCCVHGLPITQHVSCSHLQVRGAQVDALAALLAAQQHCCDVLPN